MFGVTQLIFYIVERKLIQNKVSPFETAGDNV